MRNLIPFNCLILMTLCLFLEAGSQSLPIDSLAENIFLQSYLKDRPAVNCDSAYTTLELRICANDEFKEKTYRVNYYLTEALEELEKMQNSKAGQLLFNSQVLWIEHRNEYCKVYWELYEGGSLQPVVFLYCLSALSEQREMELLNLVGNLK